MSESIRVAIAVEGPTDEVVIDAIVDTILGEADHELQVLQPDGSRAFGNAVGGESRFIHLTHSPFLDPFIRLYVSEGTGPRSMDTSLSQVIRRPYSSMHLRSER